METSETTAENNTLTLVVPPALDIINAESFLTSLKDTAPDTALTLNAEKVERITTPGVQLLLSIDSTLTKGGGKLTLQSPSEIFNNALIDLGFEDKLNEWSNA